MACANKMLQGMPKHARRRCMSLFCSGALSNRSSLPIDRQPQNYVLSNPRRSFSWWSSDKKSEPVTSPASSADISGESTIKIEESAVKCSENIKEEVLSISSGSTNDWYSPVDAAIDAISWIHDITGLPWWLTIISSAVTLRMAILPLNILQLKKMAIISALGPKLPPPLPMPGSGTTISEQYKLFSKQRRAMGCPTFLWNIASLMVQIPCFFVCMVAVRRMCLNHYPGFDCGGAFWFVDLTSYVHDPVGAVLPLCICGTHLLIVNISFGGLKIVRQRGIIGLFTKYYKYWLQFMTIPTFLIGFYIPQGSLIYWLTNNVLSALQTSILKNPVVRQRLGLRILPSSGYAGSLDTLSSIDLLALAAEHESKGQSDKALQILRSAVRKDPEMPQMYLAMGKIFLGQQSYTEAIEQLELAIEKAKDGDVLIAAYLTAGFASFRQGNKVEAISYFRKLAAIEEPEGKWSRFQYNQGLVSLASALFVEGKREEAANYLHRAAKYDPQVLRYLQEWNENPED